jgi:arginase
MTKLSIIVAPYDSGHYRSGFGSGPEAILASGLVDSLAQQGHDISVHEIGRVGGQQEREIATGFAVCNAVAAGVRAACENGRFPVVLAGNCLAAVGAVAGAEADAILWFDQHGDLHTPETSSSGFLDGMALSAVLGLCWRPMTAAIPGFRPIEAARCLLVDARDLDPGEEALLDRMPILRAACGEASGQARKLAGASRAHLHIDLDIHDP